MDVPVIRDLAAAEAAWSDFQHYDGRIAEMETRIQSIIDLINQALAQLPS